MAANAALRAATAIPISAPSTPARKRKPFPVSEPARTSPFSSGNYVSAGDLSFARSRLFAAVAQGQIKPKTAATLAFFGQTLVQTLHLSQNEYISAFGTDSSENTVAHSFQPCGRRQCPPARPKPQLSSASPAPAQPARSEASTPETAEAEPNKRPN
jgi:hypothetical protein